MEPCPYCDFENATLAARCGGCGASIYGQLDDSFITFADVPVDPGVPAVPSSWLARFFRRTQPPWLQKITNVVLGWFQLPQQTRGLPDVSRLGWLVPIAILLVAGVLWETIAGGASPQQTVITLVLAGIATPLILWMIAGPLRRHRTVWISIFLLAFLFYYLWNVGLLSGVWDLMNGDLFGGRSDTDCWTLGCK